jgi:hypothetical protein
MGDVSLTDNAAVRVEAERPRPWRNPTGMDERAHDDDPRPEPPERPASEDCCGSGCDRCVYELYEQALDRYRDELAAWERRRATGTGHR